MDTADVRATLAEAIAADRAPSPETLNMACFWLAMELNSMEFTPAPARDIARVLLRTAGRLVIDAAGPEADPEKWTETREMVVEWLDEARRLAG